ncbi:CBO0543 family protein [Virgibacillus kekensis]|uniref:CBO0543 family protein n=1 Tax=Virgibacillus kekensis TaxID=202261 RepID=A0ABV9DNX0_9BACI
MDIKMENSWRTSELKDQHTETDIQVWLDYELFSWNWWILVVFLIVPWIIWLIVYDRKILLELLLFGTLVIIATTYLDSVGIDLGFWMYPVELIPITPRAMAFDFSMVAVAFMLVYQYFRTWKAFSLGILGMAILFAFIGEPLAHALKLVYYINWNYFYSFLYYIVLGFIAKFITEKARGIEDAA